MKNLPIVLGVLAVLTGVFAWWPQGETKSAALGKTGSVFGKEDAKPEQVVSLRVATWDDESQSPKVFEVAKKAGSWVIPSQHDYPADGSNSRVGRTAGGVLGVKRGRQVSNDPKHHKELGVVDPLATEATLGGEGRGKRVTVKDETGAPLVDLIVGKAATAGEGNYVRMADDNDVYTAKVNTDISTKFTEWVEPDLMKVPRDDIRSVTIRDYSVDVQQGAVEQRAETTLGRSPDGPETWNSPQTPADKRVAKTAVDKLLTDLTSLKLVGIRPFNPMWLEGRGFFLVPDQKLLADPNALVLNTNRGKAALIGSEGNIIVTAKDGLRYQLFFGSVAVGDDEDQQAEVKKPDEKKDDAKKDDAKTDDAKKKDEGRNRYMVVFCQYDAASDEVTKKADADKKAADEKKAADGDKKDEAKKDDAPKPAAGKTKADKQQKRFAQFFYVIANKDFEALRPKVETLFEAKPAEPMAGTTGKTNKQWLEENGKKPGVTTTPSGLQYEVITASGQADAKQPKDGDEVQVNYKGTLIDGTEFDASKDKPAAFNVNGVIKGWTEALKLMKEGDKWRVYVPPELGYGEGGSPPKIGANQILTFEVELVKVGAP